MCNIQYDIVIRSLQITMEGLKLHLMNESFSLTRILDSTHKNRPN